VKPISPVSRAGSASIMAEVPGDLRNWFWRIRRKASEMCRGLNSGSSLPWWDLLGC
jgi:hypothetical protein